MRTACRVDRACQKIKLNILPSFSISEKLIFEEGFEGMLNESLDYLITLKRKEV